MPDDFTTQEVCPDCHQRSLVNATNEEDVYTVLLCVSEQCNGSHCYAKVGDQILPFCPQCCQLERDCICYTSIVHQPGVTS